MKRRDFLLASAGLAACSRPKAHRFNGYAFTSNTGSKTIGAVSLSSFEQVKEIALDSTPGALIAHPARRRVLSLLPESGTILEIDPASMTIGRRSPPNGPAVDMRLSPDGRLLWVLLRDSLIAWDLDHWRRVTWARLPKAAGSFDLHPGGHMAAITLPEQNAIGVANLSNGRVTVTQLSENPGFICFQCKGDQIFTALPASKRIAVVNTADARHMVDLSVPVAPRRYCRNADGGQMFVTGEGMDAVVIVSPYQTEVGETVLAGHAPGAMAATAGGTEYLFVANPGAGDTTVISIANRKAIAQIQTGGEPSEISLTPDGNYALILNSQSGNLAVFRLSVLQTATLQARRSRLAPLFTVVPVGASPINLAICPLA